MNNNPIVISTVPTIGFLVLSGAIKFGFFVLSVLVVYILVRRISTSTDNTFKKLFAVEEKEGGEKKKEEGEKKEK